MKGMIRKAERGDVSRIAELLVFTKRVNYRRIFHNDAYSFGEMQVLSVAQRYYDAPALLDGVWVYCDGFVKGMINLRGDEVRELYVDSFFADEGIGGALLGFAVERFDVRRLFALEKNERALDFYSRHGFHWCGGWQYEEGTPERRLPLVRG